MTVNKAFDALEIEKTTDKKLIKKAYAVLSRKTHPEEYPQKWKEVHDAYKIAINYAGTVCFEREKKTDGR